MFVGSSFSKGVDPGGIGELVPPQFLDWRDEYLIIPPFFYTFNQILLFHKIQFCLYCGHCLSYYILKLDHTCLDHLLLFFRLISCNVIDLYYKLYSIDQYINWAFKTWKY